VRKALDRAYRVAWALRGPHAWRRDNRPALHRIGVSGEDDPPHRPVNVPSARFPQHDILVDVDGLPVRTRIMVASAGPGSHAPGFQARGVPPDPELVVPERDQVILFIHGDGSRLEEALSLVPHLHRLGRARARNSSIIAMDLPSCGYSEMIDPATISTLRPTRHRHDILRFLERFVVAVVDAIDARVGIKNRITGIIGGGLGGSLVLRLGRMAGDGLPWLHTAVAWSPASVWSSAADDAIHEIAGNRTFSRSEEEERGGTRRNHFFRVFEETADFVFFNLVPPQPQTRYRADWQPCKHRSILRTREDQEEIYHSRFRRWYWRVASEQRFFSHRDPYRRDGSRSHERIRVRTFLSAGTEDDYPGTHIYRRTRELVDLMSGVGGTSLFLRDTGHSIHRERPALFAREIDAFLNPPGCAPLSLRMVRQLLEELSRR
jgi:pimeloyl-ACP methyl ester carboxylesterase